MMFKFYTCCLHYINFILYFLYNIKTSFNNFKIKNDNVRLCKILLYIKVSKILNTNHHRVKLENLKILILII